MITNIPIALDLNKKYTAPIPLVQGEKSGRRLSLTISSNGAAVDLTGKTVVLYAAKPDNTIVYALCINTTAESGKCYADITEQMAAVAGKVGLQIRIYAQAVTGTATSGAAATISDTSKTWTVNAYAGKSVYISGGTGAGQIRTIVSNTDKVLTVTPAWITNPASGSAYTIVSESAFSDVFFGTVSESDDVDDAVASSDEFPALTAALATTAGLDARVTAVEFELISGDGYVVKKYDNGFMEIYAHAVTGANTGMTVAWGNVFISLTQTGPTFPVAFVTLKSFQMSIMPQSDGDSCFWMPAGLPSATVGAPFHLVSAVSKTTTAPVYLGYTATGYWK